MTIEEVANSARKKVDIDANLASKNPLKFIDKILAHHGE